MADNKNKKARHWGIVVYPESAPTDWKGWLEMKIHILTYLYFYNSLILFYSYCFSEFNNYVKVGACAPFLARNASFACGTHKQKKDAERCTKIGERSDPIFTSIY